MKAAVRRSHLSRLVLVAGVVMLASSCVAGEDTSVSPSAPAERVPAATEPAPTAPPAPTTADTAAPATTRATTPPTTTAVTETTDCHPAYETCIPHLVGDALNCADLRADKKPVQVNEIGTDPYLLDGNQNGLGCEGTTDSTDSRDCHPAYETCIADLAGDALNCADLPPSKKPVHVKQIGTDPYLLDGDKDGRGCEDSTASGNEAETAADCHPAYTTCVPDLPGDALNCADIPATHKPVIVKVVGTDPYRLDGDRDGRGCEDSASASDSSASPRSSDTDTDDTVSRCHPAYTTCIPNLPGDALNCADLSSSQKPVRVKQTGVDPYRLDGDRDGLGCESSTSSSSTQRQTDRSTRGTCTHDGRGHAFLGYNPGTHTHPTNHTHKTGKCAGV